MPGAGRSDVAAGPGLRRIRTTRTFKVWEGGGEYNVVRGLRRCFGLRTAVVTAIPDNEVGRLLEDLMLQGGVDLSHVIWRPFDGIGRECRVGLNFTEKGLRPASGRGLFGPRLLGRLANQTRRRGLGSIVPRRRRALVPLRRHLCGPLGQRGRSGHRGHAGRRTKPARSSPTISTSAPHCGSRKAELNGPWRSTGGSPRWSTS